MASTSFFWVADMTAPMQGCLAKLQEKINQNKLATLTMMARDPVPQFSRDQILKAAQFLDQSIAAMSEFTSVFKGEKLQHMSAEALKQHQAKTRKSIQRLVLLLSDQSSVFSGSQMEGRMEGLQESSQPHEIKAKLASLKRFLETFGQVDWLGQLIHTGEFGEQIKTVQGILEGLLSPHKEQCLAAIADRDVDGLIQEAEKQGLPEMKDLLQGLKDSRAGMDVTEGTDGGMEQDRATHPLEAISKQFEEMDRGSTKEDLALQLRELAARPTSLAGWVNMLASVFIKFAKLVAHVLAQRWKLKAMCTALEQIFKEAMEKVAESEKNIQDKMEALRHFAGALNAMPEVLNQFLLVRLCDINEENLGELKQWVRKDEAMHVYDMLETFRDEVIRERALRDLSERRRGTSDDGSTCPPSELDLGRD